MTPVTWAQNHRPFRAGARATRSSATRSWPTCAAATPRRRRGGLTARGARASRGVPARPPQSGGPAGIWPGGSSARTVCCDCSAPAARRRLSGRAQRRHVRQARRGEAPVRGLPAAARPVPARARAAGEARAPQHRAAARCRHDRRPPALPGDGVRRRRADRPVLRRPRDCRSANASRCCCRSAPAWRTRTATSSCTATSSRRTSSSRRTGWSSCSTSGSPASSIRRRRSPTIGRPHRPTRAPSNSRAETSRRRPTCTRWARSPTSS